jgi:Ribonuclease G/E
MGMTRAGLVEVQRPRGRVGLRALMARPCPVCAGTGATPAPLAAALAALRQVAASGPGAPPVIVAAPDIAHALANEAAAPLAETGQRLGGVIAVETDAGLAPGAFEIRPAR